MTDRIEVIGIRGYGYHGVLSEERTNGQDFIVDVALHCDLQAAGRSDDLATTIDYGELAARIHQIIEGEPVNLIEALAERIADDVLKSALVQEVIVTVHKPSAPITVPFQDVTVTITRKRSQGRTAGGHRVVIALGSNLGDSSTILDQAIAELSEVIWDPKVSSYYRTVPVGGPPQGDFLNAVVVGATEAGPEALLGKVQEIELAHGRVRAERWGPRTLDIDLIDYDGSTIESDKLTLPHPRAHTRAFVLAPWLEVDPRAVLPGYGSVAGLLEKLDVSGVRRE